MVTRKEFQDRLDAVDTRLGKAKAEILKEIQTLKDQIGNDVSPEALATLERLEGKAADLDGLNDDENDSPSPTEDPDAVHTGEDGIVGGDLDTTQPEGSETPNARKSGE